jgi:hypothetical protein
MHWNEHVVVSRHDASQNDRDHKQMRQGEPSNHHGFVSKSVELGISEAKNNGEHRARDVTEEEREEGGDIPVLAVTYNEIEIAAKLVALSKIISDVNKKKGRGGSTE